MIDNTGNEGRFHFALSIDNDPWCKDQIKGGEGTICYATPPNTFHLKKPIRCELMKI